MENRFTFKDAVLLTLVVLTLGSVWLAMLQFNRQWGDVQAIQKKMEESVGPQARLQDQVTQLQGHVRALSERQDAASGLSRQVAELRGLVVALLTRGGGGTAMTPEEIAELTRSAVGGGSDPDATGEPAPDPATVPAFARLREARDEPGFREGGTFTQAFGGGVAKLTPLLSGDNLASTVQEHVLEALASLDPVTLEWRPLIATGWTIDDQTDAWREHIDRVVADGIDRGLLLRALPAAKSDEGWAAFKEVLRKEQEALPEADRLDDAGFAVIRGAAAEVPDAMSVTFTIREGVRFSDGRPLTAEDVKFSYDFVMNPAIAAPRQRAYLERIDRVEVTGGDAVTFFYKEPYFEFFDLAASSVVLPRHFYGSFDPDTFNSSVGLLMGSGPYRMADPTSWKPGTPIRLVRNERYWGVRPAFDTFAYPEILDDNARILAFKNGRTTLFGATPEQYIQMLDDKPLLGRTQHYEYASAIGGYRYIAWNQRQDGQPTKFADKRVRQALTMLIDRQRLIDQVMLGYATLATGPFNPQSRQYDNEVEPWPYNPDRAKALLKEAGWEDRDGDGRIENAAGESFRFRLTYPANSSNYQQMVLILKDNFALAGITLEPDPLEWGVFTDRLEKKQFDAISLGWTAGIETDIFQMFHSSRALTGGDNFMSYLSPELDAAIDTARTTLDEAERMPIWKRAHRILHEDQPYTFLFFPKNLVFIDGAIQNVEKLPLGLNDETEWYYRQ